MSNSRKAFHEIWQLKLNEPQSGCSLWLRFSILRSRNGFRELAEVSAVYSQRGAQKEIKRAALKQSFDLSLFKFEAPHSIQVGESFLNLNHCRGSLHSKGQSLSWDLSLNSSETLSFNAVPELLNKLTFNHQKRTTLQENLTVTGKLVVNNTQIELSHAEGCLSYMDQPTPLRTEAWAQCNLFQTEQGENADFIFEGFSTQPKLSFLNLPKVSSFYFRYQKKEYVFNLLKNSLLHKSTCQLSSWDFQVDQGELSFRGQIKAELKDFTGLTFETINGSLIYNSNSHLSDMKILVYRKGKLESTFLSLGTTGFEISSSQKNPYVPILL
jgi:hypothetical protein